MDTRFGSLVLGLLVMASLSLCCKADDEETYIPLVSNSWTDMARPTHRFNFQAQQTGVSKGTFNGSETESFVTVSDTLFGAFSNRNISFTVRKSRRDTTYAGRFITDTQIDLGGLRLSREN